MAATGTLGRIEEFDGTSDWDQCVERQRNFSHERHRRRDDAKKRAVFLSVIEPSTYKTLGNLVTPAKPADKMLAELFQALSTHFKPKPSEIMERFKFHSRSRKRICSDVCGGTSISHRVLQLWNNPRGNDSRRIGLRNQRFFSSETTTRRAEFVLRQSCQLTLNSEPATQSVKSYKESRKAVDRHHSPFTRQIA